MLESITGRVRGVEGQQILLETGPMVLSLLAPGYFLRHVPVGEKITLCLLFQIVTEGNRGIPMAVAFPSVADREFFTRFISVSGIGIRAAARAMVIPPGELAAAISSGDLKILRSLPGIGNSRAKQIVAKLQDSMGDSEYSFPGSSSPGSAADARAILEQLGIPASEAASLVNTAVGKAGIDASSSELVRAAMNARG
jgi:Holliday junction DNA helicase RuvA